MTARDHRALPARASAPIGSPAAQRLSGELAPSHRATRTARARCCGGASAGRRSARARRSRRASRWRRRSDRARASPRSPCTCDAHERGERRRLERREWRYRDVLISGGALGIEVWDHGLLSAETRHRLLHARLRDHAGRARQLVHGLGFLFRCGAERPGYIVPPRMPGRASAGRPSWASCCSAESCRIGGGSRRAGG